MSSKESPIRYSPYPLSHYRMAHHGVEIGPATSYLLNSNAAWNLAYLSYDFDATLNHPDPEFTVHVRRTCQTRLDGQGIDYAKQHPNGVVATLLSLPAPRFVQIIRHHSVLPNLPLYTAYGQAWLETMDRRSRLCGAGDLPEPEPENLALASEVLARFLTRT